MKVLIGGRSIGPDYPPYLIAELSANHNGSLDKALATLEMASQMGVDAVKLQTYTPDSMTINCDRDDFRICGGLWDGYNLYQLYKEAHTPYEWHEALFARGKELGITVFSTPFDENAVDLLESLNAPAYKIASFELTDLPLIGYVAKTGKPMIMSTGMANLQEISEAVDTAVEAGCKELVLLHCISGYPTPPSQANLTTIKDLGERFDCLIGLSDHTLSSAVSVASVAMGACVVEKHVTLDRNDKGPDSAFSVEPEELRLLVDDLRTAWEALGVAGYGRKPVENDNARFRRSIYFVQDLKVGDAITRDSIRRIRPGFGLPPKEFEHLIGKKLLKNVERGMPVSWEVISDD